MILHEEEEGEEEEEEEEEEVRGAPGSQHRITNTPPAAGTGTWETLWTFAAMSITPGEVLHATLPSWTRRRDQEPRVQELEALGMEKT